MSEVAVPEKIKIHHELFIGGFGGQGVLKLGLTLAEAAMREGNEVVWNPAYGPESRGGVSFCTVIISSDPIGAPIIDKVDSAIILDNPSLTKYQSCVRPNGILLVNSSLVDLKQVRPDIPCYAVPANSLAEQAGDPRTTNMVLLGAFLHIYPFADRNTVVEALGDSLTKRNRHLLPVNERALLLGSENVSLVTTA